MSYEGVLELVRGRRLGGETPPPQPIASAVPFTSGVARVIELARQQAEQWGSRPVRTHHVLVALLGQGEGLAPRALEELGVRPWNLARTLDKLDARGTSDAPEHEPPPPRDEHWGQEVIVGPEEAWPLASKLSFLLPPGTPLSFNFDDEQGWIQAGEGIDLEHYVRIAREHVQAEAREPD